MKATHTSLAIRLKGELPPAPPIPGLAQTLACRWRPLALLDWCRRTLGNRFTLYPVDLPPVVFLSHPADIRAVLTAPSAVLHPGAGGKAIHPIVGASSFMLQEADEHMQGRRTILPSFSSTGLEGHMERVAAIISDEVASWPHDTPFAVFPRLRSMSLRVILGTIFPPELGDLSRLHAHILDMLDVTTSFLLVEPRLHRVPVWRGIWRRFIRHRALVDREIQRLLASADAITSQRYAVGRLLAARNLDGSMMSPAQLRDNLVSLILAGHETTASEAAWALQLVAHSPDVQARLADEIQGGGGAYLRATVMEVLRHRPVFLFAIPRAVARPIVIRGLTYRPPVQLLPCIYLLHHDPTIYQDPYVFRPERFLNEPAEPRGWLPWGGGRKRCPGHRLATHELETLLHTTLSRLRVMPASTHVERARWRSVIVTPGHGSRLVLTDRRRGLKATP